MKNDFLQKAVATVLAALLIGAYSWCWRINSAIVLMQRDTETMQKHWKLHSWAKDQVNTLRTKHDMDIESWPDL